MAFRRSITSAGTVQTMYGLLNPGYSSVPFHFPSTVNLSDGIPKEELITWLLGFETHNSQLQDVHYRPEFD